MEDDDQTKIISGLAFWRVGTLQLQRSATGQIEEYRPTVPDGVRANAYAAGPFCYFSLSHGPRAAGVYAFFVGGTLKYIGECKDLVARFSSTGYGHISPRNLHHDGQGTNCKINSRVLAAAKRGDATEIWFHPTDDHKSVESWLIEELSPEWNGREQRTSQNQPARRNYPPASNRNNDGHIATAAEFRAELSTLLAEREQASASTLIVKAGDLHHIVGGYPGHNHRMPVCCTVMRSFMQPGDRFVYEPPKGNGARLQIEYRFPRTTLT